MTSFFMWEMEMTYHYAAFQGILGYTCYKSINMQVSTFTDYASLLNLFKEYNTEQALNSIINSGQQSESSLRFSNKDKDSGYAIDYDVYLIFDSKANNLPIDGNFYNKLSKQQKDCLEYSLARVFSTSKKFEWSEGTTSFMTIHPPLLKLKGLIGTMIFMSAKGKDRNAAFKSYTFFEVSRPKLSGE